MATKNWLRTHGILFTEFNLSTNPDAAENLRAMGYRTTPMVFIDGDVVVGYQPIRLAELLL